MTSATILTRTKARTRRTSLAFLGDNSKLDFTFILLEALKQLSEDTLTLKAIDTGSLASGTDTITIPANMIESNGAIDSLAVGASDDSRNDPFVNFITWDEYVQGRIRGMVLRDGTIFVTPKENSDRNYTLNYRKFHAESVTTIEFNDKYQKALINLCCSLVYDDLELTGKSEDQLTKYRRELSRIPDSNSPPVVTARKGRI